MSTLQSETIESEIARKQAVMAMLSEHPFEAPLWLRNAHLQTIGARYLRRVPMPPVHRETWDTPDDDFLIVHKLDGDDDKPVVLMLHGLEGCVESTYMKGLLWKLHDLGWTGVAMNFRSCGGPINRARRMYHSGETTDAAFALERLAEDYPGRPVYMVGYSLGGNVTGKLLGEAGEDAPDHLKGAAIISAPYDLVASGKHMDSTISRFYVLHFLRMLIPKAIEKEKQYPGCVDIERIKQSRTFADFDTHATAALHGFEDAHDYYTKVGCGQFLHNVRRPTMLLSASDDPFNPGETQPYAIAEESPWLYPQFMDRGGHVGFVRKNGPLGVGFWIEEHVARFFQAIHESY